MSDQIIGSSAIAEAATRVEPGAAADGDAVHGDAGAVEDAVPVANAELVDVGDVGDVGEGVDGVEVQVVEVVEVGVPAALDDVEEVAETIDVVDVITPVTDTAPAELAARVEAAEGAEDVAPPGSGDREASSIRTKPAGAKPQGKANGSGAKAERTANDAKSPKKKKKKSGKAKSHNGETAGSVTTPPSSATSEGASVPSDDEKPVSGRRQRVRRALADNFLAMILGIATVALAVALALTVVQLGNKNTLGTARASALAAGRTYAVELAGYDYRHLDQDFGVVLAHSTPSFRRSFSKSSDALKSTLLKYQASAKATVVAAGLISATTGRAVALVFLDQTVTNSTQKRPTTDRSQVEITLVRSGGTWLIDQVTLL